MNYSVAAKPEPSAAAVRALLLFGVYLITKHRTRSARDTRDAMTWIKRSADCTYKKYVESEIDLDWIPRNSQDQVKLFYHLSTTDADRANLFNLYRDAVLKYVAEWEVEIDDEMLPFFLALEPYAFPDFDTPELRQKYALSHAYFFDRTFVTEAFDLAGRPRRLSSDVIAQYMLNIVDGMWLMYRFSSAIASINGAPLTGVEQTRMNVSFVRIRPFAHLSPFERSTPLFIYESCSDAPDDPIMRVQGHLYPGGGRINFLGQRVRQEEATPAPIVFNWPLEVGLSHDVPHMTKNWGVAYGMNSSSQRIAFYYLALSIPDASQDSKELYDEKVEVYKRLVGVYATATLDTELRAALANAQKMFASESPELQGSLLAGRELPLPVPTQDDLNELFRRSREDIVFKRR